MTRCRICRGWHWALPFSCYPVNHLSDYLLLKTLKYYLQLAALYESNTIDTRWILQLHLYVTIFAVVGIKKKHRTHVDFGRTFCPRLQRAFCVNKILFKEFEQSCCKKSSKSQLSYLKRQWRRFFYIWILKTLLCGVYRIWIWMKIWRKQFSA